MKFKILLCLLIVTFFIACNNKEEASCYYRFNELLDSNKKNLIITYNTDTLIEVQDKVKDSTYSFGVYSFDKRENLKFYGFFIDSTHYKYSEEYDSYGNITKKQGPPLVEYRLFKEDKDTILFNAYLFSLNKKYEDIEIISNNQDTIRPKYLYKADIYSNVKCFPFKLPVAENITDLVLYARGVIINTCTQEKESFSDTTSFKQIRF